MESQKVVIRVVRVEVSGSSMMGAEMVILSNAIFNLNHSMDV